MSDGQDQPLSNPIQTEDSPKAEPPPLQSQPPQPLQSPFPVLSKHNNLLVPSVISMNLGTVEAAPWRESTAKPSDYFNYGFNEELWRKYSSAIQSKFDSLSELVAQQKFILPNLKDEFNYLLNFPSDFGGLGDVLNDNNFDNVNFFETKVNSHQLAPLIRIDHDQLYVPLEISSPALNSFNGNICNNFVPFKNIINPVPSNPFPVMPAFNQEMYKYYYQQQQMLQQKEDMEKKLSNTGAEHKSKSWEERSDSGDSDDDSSDSESESRESSKERKKRRKHKHKHSLKDHSNSHSHKHKKSKRSETKSRDRHHSRSKDKRKRDKDKSSRRKHDKHRRK